MAAQSAVEDMNLISGDVGYSYGLLLPEREDAIRP